MDNSYLKKQADEIEKAYSEYMVEMKKLFDEQGRLAAGLAIKKIKKEDNKKNGK